MPSRLNRVLQPLRSFLVAVLFTAAPSWAQQVTLERDSPLYAEPRLESSPVAQLKQGATGEVTGKQGAWLQLNTPAGSGWLYSFNVRFPSQQSAGGEAGVGAGLGKLFGPRRSVSVASAIGIRGLEEEDLKQAKFDADQMKLFDGYVASKQSAEAGARGAELAPASVDYLDAKK